jgi:hypothetical protein
VIKNSAIVSNPSDANAVTAELCNALFAQETNSERITYFTNSFLLQDQSSYYWTDAWNSFIRTDDNSVIESRLKLLIINILRAPESQMF